MTTRNELPRLTPRRPSTANDSLPVSKLTGTNLYVLGKLAAGEALYAVSRPHVRRLHAAGMITDGLKLTDAGRALVAAGGFNIELGLKGRPVVA